MAAWVGAVPSPVAVASGPGTVAIVCGHQRTYREAADALIQTLSARGHHCVRIDLPGKADEAGRRAALTRLAGAEPTVIAAGGSAATRLALQTVPDVPVVFFMVPNALDAAFTTIDDAARGRVSGVAADISPADRMDWIARTQRHGEGITLLYSARTRRTAEALRRAGQDRGIRIELVEADRARFPEAIDTLNETGTGAVLMIPDAKIYNSATVQRLLLWGARRKKPVWAFSSSIVKAGALAGQFADGRDVGRQAADLLQKVIGGAPPDKLNLEYPRRVGRAVNERTARMLDVTVADPSGEAEVVRIGE